MSVIKNVEKYKVSNEDTVILIKVGSFYKIYGKDAYILSYLFKYKLKKIENSLNECGFLQNIIDKVRQHLQNLKINYIILDNGKECEEIEKVNFEKENTYKSYYNKAYKYGFIKERVDLIYDYMIENILDENFKEKLNKIEEILF